MIFRITRFFMIVACFALAVAACAAKESYVLDEYVLQIGADRQEAQRAMDFAGPLLMEDCTDRASSVGTMPLVDRVQFAQELMEVIGDVTGSTVTRIIFVDPAEANGETGGMLDGSLTPGCGRCRIGKRYTTFLEERHAHVVRGALGQAETSKLDYRVRSTLKGVCEPGIRETLFYYLAYATYLPGRSARMHGEGFERLVQVMMFAIPLGEKVDEPGAWYVKVH